MLNEIEVKYRVSDAASVVEALRRFQVTLDEAVIQDDQAYAPRTWSWGDSKIGVAFARLRTQDGRHWFTVKRPIDTEQSCAEYETEVTDRSEMHAALQAMSYRPTVRIRKRRRRCIHRGYELCLDEVEGVGVFLEVEARTSANRSPQEVRAELETFVASLGIDGEPARQTYDTLVHEAR